MLSRREFLRNYLIAYLSLFSGKKKNLSFSTKVVLVRDAEVLDGNNNVNYSIVMKMIDSGVKELMNEKDTLAAWKKLIGSSEIIGIKSNVWQPLSTPQEIEMAIVRRLVQIGIKEENIGIDDRGVLKNKIFQKADALINVRPLRTHHWAGIGGCIKNYIMFVKEPSDYHPGYCSDLGKIWTMPLVKGKTKLNILIVLTPLFYGIGPHHYNPKYTWKYYGLLFSLDPVAIDSIGIHLLQTKRRVFFNKELPFTPPPIHVVVADKKYHLGISDINKIKLIKIGWQQDILI